MLQKNPSLIAPDIESILEGSTEPITTTSAYVANPFTGLIEEVSWGSDATGAGLVQADLAIAAIP